MQWEIAGHLFNHLGDPSFLFLACVLSSGKDITIREGGEETLLNTSQQCEGHWIF